MRTASRWFVRFVLLLVAALLLGTVVPRPLVGSAASEAGEKVRILVLSSHIHTDIAVPVEAVVKADFDFLRDAGLPMDDPNARWVLFGWGGKAFYVATPQLTDITIGPLLQSFTLDSSVMHVQATGAIDEQRPFVTGFAISEEGLRRLLAFARASFAETAGAPVQIEGTGYGDSDTFFEAVGSFNAFIGCNTWASAALREAGLRTGWWNPLPQTLVYSLKLYN